MCHWRRGRAVLVLLSVLPLAGCLFRSHKVQTPLNLSQLKSATREQLVDYINDQDNRIQTMQATVDIDTAVGGEKKGEIVDYQEIRGYVLARKPSLLRMIGLMPIVRNRAFDMVSDGRDFKLWIPPKNRFIVGRNDVQVQSPKQTLENLRPQHIYDALLLRRIDPQDEIAVLRNATSNEPDAKGKPVRRADYVLEVIRKGEHGWYLSREIIFSRIDLLPHRQLLYDEKGEVSTNAMYEDYRNEGGINFPWQIEIARPQEEYDITLTLVKLDLNQPLADDKFTLDQPPGVDVVHLDKGESTTPAHPGGSEQLR